MLLIIFGKNSKISLSILAVYAGEFAKEKWNMGKTRKKRHKKVNVWTQPSINFTQKNFSHVFFSQQMKLVWRRMLEKP